MIMFGFLRSKKEKEREEAKDIIREMHTYFDAVKKKFPNKKEIFYLALAWALFAKKNYPEKYQRHDLARMFFLGMGDAAIHSYLTPPDSIDAMAIYMIHKVHLSIANEYEAEYGKYMSKVDKSPETVEKSARENVDYLNEVRGRIRGVVGKRLFHSSINLEPALTRRVPQIRGTRLFNTDSSSMVAALQKNHCCSIKCRHTKLASRSS